MTTLPHIDNQTRFTAASWALLQAEYGKPKQTWRTVFAESTDPDFVFRCECKAKFVESDYLIANFTNGNETHVLFDPQTWAILTTATRDKRREFIERRGDRLQLIQRYENY